MGIYEEGNREGSNKWRSWGVSRMQWSPLEDWNFWERDWVAVRKRGITETAIIHTVVFPLD